MTTYNATVLDAELKKAGLIIDGVDSDGNIAWVGEPTAEQLATAQTVKANHNPAKVLTLTFSIFELLAKEFYNDEAELNAWAKESIFVSNLLTDKNFTATAETIALLKARIQKSKDDVDSALTDDLADRLLAKVAEIEAQLV